MIITTSNRCSYKLPNFPMERVKFFLKPLRLTISRQQN